MKTKKKIKLKNKTYDRINQQEEFPGESDMVENAENKEYNQSYNNNTNRYGHA